MSAESSTKRYLLTGGGTGGHVYPAIAIADELRRREPEATFLYVGVKGKAEEKIVPARGYPLTFVTSEGWPGARPSLSLLKFAVALLYGVLRSFFIIRKFKPTLIVATGGYVSAPIMLAWVVMKRLKMTEAKAFVHEQNLVPGRLNQLVGKLADRVGVSFEESRRFFPNALMVGYPARSEIDKENREEARKELGLPLKGRIVLAFGGSQGSRSINRAIVDALPSLLEVDDIHVVHGVGRYRGAGYNPQADTYARIDELTMPGDLMRRYELHEYLDPIEKYYAASDLVVCRAGAGSLTEVALCGLPALIIPKANLPGDHQVRNARALGDGGAGRVVYEQTRMQPEGLIETVDGVYLAEAIKELLDDPQRRKEMGEAMKQMADPGALKLIVDSVQAIAAGRAPAVQPPPPRGDKPELTEMSGAALVSYLSRHGVDSLGFDDQEYLAYRTDGYLASPSWQTRNIGVKLIGLLKLEDKLDLLLFLLNDPTPAVWWHRMLGGDRKQVGFIRRNALTSLRQLNLWNDDIRQALLACFSDRYFEVRSGTARTAKHFASHLQGDSDFIKGLMGCCADPSFEVVVEGIHAICELEKDEGLYAFLKTFFTHANWRVREAVLHAMKRMIERELISYEVVQRDLEQFLVTSSGFVPHFQLREQIRQLSHAIEQARDASCSTT